MASLVKCADIMLEISVYTVNDAKRNVSVFIGSYLVRRRLIRHAYGL
jgi:hypothetical protein